MYDELVKRIWECASGECFNCSQYTETTNASVCSKELMKQAADAIEELMRRCEQFQYMPPPAWIPVTERLPVGGDDSGAVCENVCLMMDDGTVSCGWMNGITKKAYYLNARDDFIIKAPITRVTHWMPLPEPPKEEAT